MPCLDISELPSFSNATFGAPLAPGGFEALRPGLKNLSAYLRFADLSLAITSSETRREPAILSAIRRLRWNGTGNN